MSRARSIAAALPRALRSGTPRLARLRPDEMLLFALSPLALPLAALALGRFGLGRVQRSLARRRGAPAEGEALARVQRLSWCVQVAAAYGPWPANCLQRSVVLCWYLHRLGLAGDLRIGVRRTDADGLDFHAWVEHHGRVVNDRRDVRERYVVFDRPITPTGARFS
jgi:hypothetical protein